MNGGGNVRRSSVLWKQFSALSTNPAQEFSVGLVHDDNLYEWEVVIFGPADTPYEGGIFKCRLDFPTVIFKKISSFGG